MFTLHFAKDGRFFEKVENQQSGDEWATRMKNVEIGQLTDGTNQCSEASVTVIHCLEDDLVELCGHTYRTKEEVAIVIVFADDTETYYGFKALHDAVDFANNMIKLLSTPDKLP